MAGSDDILGFYQLEIVDNVHFLNDLSWLMTYELFLKHEMIHRPIVDRLIVKPPPVFCHLSNRKPKVGSYLTNNCGFVPF